MVLPILCPINIHYLTGEALATLAVLGVVYILGTGYHNIYLHPLSKFPGPKIFAATELANLYYVFRGTRVFKVAQLHDKYGPIVRVSPNELSYIIEDAWRDIYTTHKGNGQLNKYMGYNDDRGLFDAAEIDHGRLRKKASLAFSEKMIREHEDILHHYANLLITRLKGSTASAEDMTGWYGSTTLDIIGHLAFGESFHSLDTSTLHPLMPAQHELLKLLATSTALLPFHIAGLWRLLFAIRNFYSLKLFLETAQIQLEKRATRKRDNTEKPDFISLISKDIDTPGGLSSKEMHFVARDFLIGGADTTATVIAVLPPLGPRAKNPKTDISQAATYFLLMNPTKHALLKHELRSTFASQNKISLSEVSNLKYLNAVILESMRLIPPGPETMRRVSNGNMICGDFIPAGTRVGVYHWAAGHNSASWRDAESFVPERWLDDERYRDDKRGVLQFFQAGPRNCVGQNLANAEMRLILAKVFWTFDLELCEESKGWTKMKAWGLTYAKRPLMVKVKCV
ncbi:cytochrome P450 [Bisporella sp. PMI_857]|nr:cytochrome P450 [Bisporella sp. PMI_857]